MRLLVKATGICIAGALVGAVPSFAQTISSLPEISNTRVAAQSDYAPLGIRLGSTMLNAGLGLGLEHNDNIFATPILEQDDTILHVLPYVDLRSDWSRHALNLHFDADLAKYSDFDSEDYDDLRFKADGRLDVVRDSYLFGEVFANDLHEPRTSSDDRGGVEPTRFDFDGFKLGYNHLFNWLLASIEYGLRRLKYEDVATITGRVINNQDRNRDEAYLRLQLGYEYRPGYLAFVRYIDEDIQYDDIVDDFGLQRSSNGYTAHAGVAAELTGVLDGEIYLGYVKRDYDEPTFIPTSEPYGGLRAIWTPTGLTTVNARIDTRVEETTDPNAAGYLSTGYHLRVDHELKRNIVLKADAGYRVDDYDLTLDATRFDPRREDTTIFGLGVKYRINRNFSLDLDYAYEDRDSNVFRNEYKLNRWLLTLTGGI